MNKVKTLSKILDNEEIIDLTVSYSKLSDFDRNGAISLIRRTSVNGNGVKIGSLVDDLLFLSNEDFNNLYYKFDGDKPTATLGLLCDVITKNYTSIPSVVDVGHIALNNGFWNNIKNPTLYLEKYNIKEFWDYLKCIFEASDKIIITTSEYNEALELVSILKENKYSKDILSNNLDNYYQVKFEYDYKGFIVKGIIDILTIDHVNKTVQLIDLKTGKNNAVEFEESFVKWRYYFQGALYQRAFDEICKSLNLIDYTLLPFKFLYISKSDKTPLIFIMTDKWLNAAYNGFNIGKYKYRGINELLDEIYWCWKNKEYLIPKFIIENNGVVELKDNFIEVNE